MGTGHDRLERRVAIDGGEICQTEYWSPEVIAFDRSSVRWPAVTTSFGEPYGNQRGGVEVTLVGPPGALVRVETTAGRLVTRLATAASDGVVNGIVRGEGRLRLQPGVGGLVGIGANEARVSHVDQSGEPGWYMARVYLTDGEMAWSSPI